ncbi:MAG: hypothetical protein KatS3mg087_0839 [Patescibacteria group bacterium]|nr:MAG: hypothetical protein KatS3mg087_0839 [Patescibacteria group bacterium]
MRYLEQNPGERIKGTQGAMELFLGSVRLAVEQYRLILRGKKNADGKDTGGILTPSTNGEHENK